MDAALELQGMPWLVRKAVAFATITGQLSQEKDENDVTTIQVATTATGGIKGETEIYRLDGSESTQGSGMFGVQKCRAGWLEPSKPVNLLGLPIDPWLLDGWLDEASGGSPNHIIAHSVNEKAGWTAEQVWGFAMVEGNRRRVTKFLVTKGSAKAMMRIVYDFVQ